MESTEAFMEIFTRSWEEKNNDALMRILKEAPAYLQNLPQSDNERTLEIIFDERKGLFKVIKTLLGMQKNQLATFQGSLKEAFTFLQFIMDSFKREYETYILQTKEVCFYCMKTVCWYYARKTAAETLKKLIESYTYYDIPLDDIIEYYKNSYLRYYTKKDGCIFYIVLGAIAKSCPKTENVSNSIETIFSQLLKDFKQQFNENSNKQPEEIRIYLDCLSDILTNFVPFDEEFERKAYFEKFYFYLLKLCQPNGAQKTIRSKDYMKWHILLNAILKENENYTIVGALRGFYAMMASTLLRENNQDIFLYFKNYFILNLSNEELSSHKARLIIHGFGDFSAAYAKYLPTETYEMFQMITIRTSSFYAKENENEKNFEATADYLKTLSKILYYVPNVSLHQVNVITELTINLTKRFPEMKLRNENYTTSALKATFVNMSKLEKKLQQDYFNTFFREGILWSCSHTLLVDIELQQEFQKTSEQPISYKNYLPLWCSLFDIDNKEEYSKSLILQIFNEFVNVLISFIDKLNLNVTIQENNFFSNDFFLLKADNETDFRFFVNLVDLFVDVFDKVEAVLFQDCLEKLLIYLIKCSYKHPLISGFYKLIEVIFKKPDVFIDYEMDLNQSTRELIPQYLSDILEQVCRFSGELQLSCIYLIFNTPSFFISDLVNQTSSVFKIAFEIGSTDLSLAFCALETLENWVKDSSMQCSNDFLKNVVLYTEPYLSSEESLVDLHQGIEKKKKSNIKNASTFNSDESFEALQKRILLFYGSIDSTVLFDFVHEKSIRTNATWNKKNDLQCELLFPDIRVEMHFDKLLPRIIELTKSGDRRTKMSACELFHTIITIVLGKKLTDQCFDKSLCNTILRLGCDSDDGVRNLYHPFVMQLIHYLSSKLMTESRIPQDFVDALFEGLTEEFNPFLRDYCGIYLKEFMEWSIKQSTENYSSNTRGIIRRITNLALYPSNKKRLAAAVAFNHLYTILRENTTVVNTYWLELLYAFIKCMEECNDIQIINALNHIVKVIQVKPNLFNAKTTHRRKPPGFLDETLKGTLTWLFDYCGSTDTMCRDKCTELFENLKELIADYQSIENNLVNNINGIISKNLKEDFECFSVSNAKAFLRTLDFYIWIFKKKIIPIESLRTNEMFLKGSQTFFQHFRKCISLIVNENVQTFVTLYSDVLAESDKLTTLTNEIVLKILVFLSTIILEKDHCLENIPWDDNLYLLITHCTLYPNKIGLTSKKMQIFEKLPSHLVSLLMIMKKNLPETYLTGLQNKFVVEIKEQLSEYAEIQEIVKLRKNINELQQFVKGLSTLKKCEFIDFEKELDITASSITEKLTEIFQSTKTEIMDTETPRILDKQVKDYLHELIKFFLEDCQLEVVEIVISLILNNGLLTKSNGTTISHGEHFLETFKDQIFRCLLKNSAMSMKIFDELFIEFPDRMFSLVEDLLIFAHRERVPESEALADTVISRCYGYQRVTNDFERRNIKFFNINRLAVSLKANPAEAMKKDGSPSDIYRWILQELMSAENLDRKAMILRNFLMCLTNEELADSNHELTFVLQQLRTDDIRIWLQKLELGELRRFQAMTCFQVLLKMLPVTKSIVVYETCMKFSAGSCKFLIKESVKDYLSPYFASITEANALKSLQRAYNVFMDLKSSDERLDVLRHFLLPSIELNKKSVIEKFYEEKCQEMVTYLAAKSELLAADCVADRKKLFVTKIACFNVFELIFGRFELTFLTVKHPITKADKPLNQFLAQETLFSRCLSSKSVDEREITRLLHCAAMNCCITLFSLKEEEKFYKYVFLEDKAKNQLVWENIVDCERRYELRQAPATLRLERKKLINIRKRAATDDELEVLTSSYFHRYNLTSLTLLEDIHAYDFNDMTLLAQAKGTCEKDCRLNLTFENDQLNDHECMPMITGILVHMFNTEIVPLPDDSQDDLPDCLKTFRNGFSTTKDNARLFLMKVVGNCKAAFIPYMKPFFVALADTVSNYLRNNPLNYVVRDILVIIIESKYKITSDTEKKVTQLLINNLIERIPDKNNAITRYNLEILESLCQLWHTELDYPTNLDDKIESNPDLAIRVTLVLLRTNVKASALCSRPEIRRFIYDSVQHWKDNESIVLEKFEALGHLLRFTDDTNSCADEISRLKILLQQIDKSSNERCARCVCALYRGCRTESKCKDLFSFAKPSRVDDAHKPGCLELFLQRLPDIETLALPVELTLLDLRRLLRERVLGCEGPALRIVEQLVPRLSETELQPYLDLVASFTSACSLLEHRRCAYSILMDVYTKYPPPHRFASISTRWLVVGVDDPAEDLQKFVLSFWRERVKLPDTCCERMQALLDAYTPELRASFPRFLCLLMLELTSKSIDDKHPMFTPLSDCTFRDYEVFVPRRRKNLGSMAPLFAPSLASQLSQASQYSQLGPTFGATANWMRILATRDLEFEPTAPTEAQNQGVFLVPSQVKKKKLPDPSQNKLSYRLASPKTASEASDVFSQQRVKRQREYVEKRQREMDERRNGAKVYRKYRIGEFPDVEITHASLVECLRQVIIKDWLVCKDFAVALACSLIERLKGTDKYASFMDRVSATVERVLKQPEVSNGFAPIVLEVALKARDVELRSDAVVRMCKTMGLHSLGILLLEEETTEREMRKAEETPSPAAKRAKLTYLSPDKQNWIELANLYKAVAETDVVNSIFARKNLVSEELRKAVLAQAEGNWSLAKSNYEFASEIAMDYEKEHCLEGTLECLSELSNWSEINKKIETILNGDYGSVWSNPRATQLLPWIFRGHLHKALDDYTANKDLENATFIAGFDDWIRGGREAELRRIHGEEMAVLYACGEKPCSEEIARHCLRARLDGLREIWTRTCVLEEKERTRILLRLRGLRDVSEYAETLKAPDLEQATKELMGYWERRVPTAGEDLMYWNMHVNYRMAFAHLLRKKLGECNEDSSVFNEVVTATVSQRMNIAELAMSNRNNNVAKKHTLRVERIVHELDDDEDSAKLKNNFTLMASKYKFLCGEMETSAKKKCNYYVSSWQIADELINDDNADLSTKIKAKYHLFDLTTSLSTAVEQNRELLNLVMSNEFVMSSVSSSSETNDIFGALKDFSFSSLKSVCGAGEGAEMAESYARFGRYCYSLVHESCRPDSALQQEFISAILTAMSLGSLEAAHYFPCLLKYEYYRDNEQAMQLFSSKSEAVPSWFFLAWQAQIMSHLGKTFAQILIPIVKRLIEDYPNGVMYNFRQTYETLPELRQNPEVQGMYDTLFGDKRMETFFEALHRVCQPEHFARHHLMRVFESKQDFSAAFETFFNTVYAAEGNGDALQGPLYKVLDKCKPEIEKLRSMDYETAKKSASNISEELYRAMKKRLANVKKLALQLKDYSPFLGRFSDQDFEVEVPGQYTGNKKPLLRYHIKILKFDRFIRIMESKCNPIKIGMIGNDAKTYGFLVKFGEDLRQDQRLQQIFSITNKTLDNDANCKRRYLSINTYHVVPLSTTLGLIEWVDNTKSLKEFVEFSLSDRDLIESIAGKYDSWIAKASKSSQRSHNYKQALIKYSPKDVITKMKELVSQLDWDCFRKTFVMLSPSLDCFVSLRRNFIVSYATMCIIHWVTGVGDRHLENMLIEVKTGKCYGIDFGMAFGAGIDQLMPELVPFRLTPQITGLFKPFDEQALFGVTMTHVLSALRNEKGPLLASLDVFVHEPLDWSGQIKKQIQDDSEEQTDVKWLPKKKIAIIEKKLNGAKPSTIMIEELSNAHIDSDDVDDYFSKYEHIINGTDSYQITMRSRMKDVALTAEEQVQCLLEQATDLNVLGRMWVGWCPFV